jgi:hypothetical protein
VCINIKFVNLYEYTSIYNNLCSVNTSTLWMGLKLMGMSALVIRRYV